MHHAPIALLAGGLLAALLLAIVTDLRSRIIPNGLTAAVALAAPLWWWATGIGLWPGAALQLGVAGIALALFAAELEIGAMGGGAVKLISDLGLCGWRSAAAR